MKHHNIKSKLFLMVAMLITIHTANAQYHDGTKMNQFLMQETGAGSFQPESEFILYDIFHRSYKETIVATNKSVYRLGAYEGNYKQIEYADSIKKRLEDRAKEEAVNMADRTVDVAWLTEQSKIESAINNYKSNLSKLASCGATSEEKEDWQYYANMYDFAVDRTRKAYMANSERQKEFLEIYNEVTNRNTKLIKRIRYLKGIAKSKNILAARNTRTRTVLDCANAAYNRWRDSASAQVASTR